ncbi:MAG: hypothetical protein MAGBODY4_00803 [Candidatus Marinimicrobia bacterium]|nr:hypothetical protein [Candidatus Neomarinimicrobiota bacterium]
MSFVSDLNNFITSLNSNPDGPVFNPWYMKDPEHDATSDAPEVRKSQLRQYLLERRHSARWLFIAEALGYRGGHFSGMAMTSERILLGHKTSDGVKPAHVFRDFHPQRTSKTSVKEKGFSENTATTVWKTLIQFGIDPYDVVLWNAFPWHPYEPDHGLLSNRTPTGDELEIAGPYLRKFLQLFPGTEVIALGNHSSDALTTLKVEHTKLRHPSFGGAPEFKSGLRALLGI